ncbi:MAG: hypothetical protein KGY60_06830 [Bacteroidales bacterium]|nr:hypothetical protein [Bacteroidales bacterium]
MRPAKILLPLATFFMRLGAGFYLYLNHFPDLLAPSFQRFDFYLSAIFAIFGLLLILGAFARKQTLTVLSALILFAGSLYKIFTFAGGLESHSFLSLLLFGVISFFFLCNGNKNR